MENLKHKGLGMLNRIKGEGRNNITSFENQPKKKYLRQKCTYALTPILARKFK